MRITRVFAALAAGCLLASRHSSPAAEAAGARSLGQPGVRRYFTPANQILTPVGTQVELPGLRPQALALSPDGRLLVTAGKTPELVVVDPPSGRILQRVPLPSDQDKDPAPDSVSAEILEPDKAAQV